MLHVRDVQLLLLPLLLHRVRRVPMAEREGVAPPTDAPNDLGPAISPEEIPPRNDSTAPVSATTTTTAAARGREPRLELGIIPSPPQPPASFPQEGTTPPPITSPSHPSQSRDSTAQAPSPLGSSSNGNRSNASATDDSSREQDRPSPRQRQRSTLGQGVSPLGTPRSRTRVRAPVESLPAAFPPPSRRGSGSDSSSASSSLSPLADNGVGVGEEGGGLGGGGLDVNASSSSELELSVPSHKEHLTADGQRYTTYEVVVRMGGRQWSVRKRYSQFDQFRMSLRKQHKEVGSFRFPNKSKFNTFSEHTKERRRTGFDGFLRLVAGLHPRPQEVDVFLAMDEHGAGVLGGSGNRPMAWTSAKVFQADTPTGPEVGRAWSETGRSDGGRRLSAGSGVDRLTRGGTLHRVPRFPPLADQGRSEKAAEAAAAVAAAAAASASSKSGLSSVVHQADLVLKKLLGPDLLSMLCVVAVSAVSIVVVWKIGGKPGIATLVVGVCVGLFVQNWDRGLDVLNWGLELVGMGPESSEPPSSGREPSGPHSSGRGDRPRAESTGGALGCTRQAQAGREGGRQ